MKARLDRFISWTIQALFITATISGIPLIFAYHPNNAFDSVQKITYSIPFGFFIRKIHYFSSEIMLILIVIHIIQKMYNKEPILKKKIWIFGSLSFLAIIILIFTGYVLKADQAGKSAALVAENMLKNSYILNYMQNFIVDKNVLYWKFLLWHAIFIPAIASYLVYLHTKKITVNAKFIVIAIGLAIVTSYILPFPKDIGINITKVKNLTGPWFFKGVENMLKLNFPVDISILAGILPFIVLCFFSYANKKTLIKSLLFLWIIFYVSVSLV
jgi:ubiquinol-cytochrome c reductase cytochrome b subunit